MKIALPSEYVRYLAGDPIVEGFTRGAPRYIVLWPLKDIERNNENLHVETLAPGFIGFGGDGDGEMLAFDERGAVYQLPMIGMAPRYALRIAQSWIELEQRIVRET